MLSLFSFQDIFLTGLLELGCPRMCAVSCECCVVIVCLFGRQDSCVTGLLVFVCSRHTTTTQQPHAHHTSLVNPFPAVLLKKHVLANEQAQHDYTAHTGHSTHPWTSQHQQSHKKMSWRAKQDNISTQHTQGI